MRTMFDPEDINRIFSYDPETGNLYRRETGELCASKTEKGYIRTRVKGQGKILAHRAAFLIMIGSCPEHIDHINGNRSDNRWENLREVTHEQNIYNSKTRQDSLSGVKGVRFLPLLNKYIVRLHIQGKRHALGYFDDLEAAELVSELAQEKYRGEYKYVG